MSSRFVVVFWLADSTPMLAPGSIPELGTGQPVELVTRLDPGTQSLATR